MIKRFLPYIGPLIGITGISLGLYFHAQSIQERAPVYYVGPRSTIVDSSIATPSPIQVLYKGHPVGNKDVVAMVVYLWNSGKMPIRAEDVLEQVSIDLGSSELLEARILHVSRSVTKFEMGPVPDPSTNVLPISFNILEKSDGAAVQIIYAGKSDAPITVHGTVVGAGTPRLFSEGQRVRSPEEALQRKASEDRFVARMSYGITVPITGMFVFLLWLRAKSNEQRPQVMYKWELIPLVGVTLLLFLAMDVTVYIVTHRPEIPSSVFGQ